MSAELLTAARGTAFARRIRVALIVAFCSVAVTSAVQPQAPPPPRPADTTAADALRARRNAEEFERRARVLTLFDRRGKLLTTIGEPGLYFAPVLSPDGTRIAVLTRDLERDTIDLCVITVASGRKTMITANRKRSEEPVQWPVWSPDGRELAYIGLRAGYWGVYRKAADGSGSEELLHRSPGANLAITDWSLDGRQLHFHSTDLSGGTLYVLPLAGRGERAPITVLRNEFQLRGSRPSPDNRWLAYQSNVTGRDEVHVRSFDPAAVGPTPGAPSWQVSQGIQPSPAFWRQDGKELLWIAGDRGLMSAEVTTSTSTFAFRKPTLLFRLSEAVPVAGGTITVSADGQRALILVPAKPTLQQIRVFDRRTNQWRSVGPPGRYFQPMLSPDGTRVAVIRVVPQTGDEDVWTFDVASGRGIPVTKDVWSADSPVWSPDGRQVAYVSRRGDFEHIYRKASDGTGTEEALFQYTPGAGMELTDWSADGNVLVFQDGCAGVVHVLPLNGNPQHVALDWLRDEYNVGQARLSPDSRFMAYLSDEIEPETFELYVRPFDVSQPDVSASGAKGVRVSTAGARGMISWRQDGKEIYFLSNDDEVLAVELSGGPTLQVGPSRRILTVQRPAYERGDQQWSNVSRDGQRLVVTLNVPVSVSPR